MTASPSALESPDVRADRSLLAQNAGFLLAGQVLGLAVPLLTVPYLARILGPEAWGPVVAAQSLGNWLAVILEFGFDLSGTRAVARSRVAPHTTVEVVHGVQSAKALLTAATLMAAIPVFLFSQSVRDNALLVVLALVFAVTRGFSPLWFFQGIERVRGAVMIDTLCRTAASLGVFFLVTDTGDGWRVLALQAGFGILALVLLTARLTRHVALRPPQLSAAIQTLREASSIFACRAWSGLYIQGNALILSALAGPVVVAMFGGAERIIRAAINLLQPLTQVFLPRITHLHEVDPAAARRLIRQTLVGVGLVGLAMGLCATLGAPLLVHILLGAQFEGAIPVLRLMGALPVLVALNTVLGLYWALPFGRDRLFLASIVVAGIANVVFAVVLVRGHGAVGMAIATIIAETAGLGVLALGRGGSTKRRENPV